MTPLFRTADENEQWQQKYPAARAGEARQQANAGAAEDTDHHGNIARFFIGRYLPRPQQSAAGNEQHDADNRPIVSPGQLNRSTDERE